MTQPTAQDFYAPVAKRSHVGWAAWLRSLPCDTPTQVPEEIREKTTAVDLRAAVVGTAQSVGIRVKTRTVDGEIWVLRLQS